jgi:hypothetical protein
LNEAAYQIRRIGHHIEQDHVCALGLSSLRNPLTQHASSASDHNSFAC